MLKNHKLARGIADRGFGEFRRQLEDKAVQRGKTVVVVNRWYPGSKTCLACGYHMPKMPLAMREWTCPACGTPHDRDVNAAINLRKVAESSMDSLWSALPWTAGPLALRSGGMMKQEGGDNFDQ